MKVIKNILIVLGAITGVSLLLFLGGFWEVDNAPASGTSNTPASGTGCISQYSNLQLDAINDLSWLKLPILTSMACETQKRVLDVLADYPRDERNEEFDRMIDKATAKR